MSSSHNPEKVDNPQHILDTIMSYRDFRISLQSSF
jgi:hypothetical protein